MKATTGHARAWLEDPGAPLPGADEADDVATLFARALLASQDECERLRAVLDWVRSDLDRAVAAHDPSDPRHRSHGGQHDNGPCCAFGNVTPGALSHMKRLRTAIDRVRRGGEGAG